MTTPRTIEKMIGLLRAPYLKLAVFAAPGLVMAAGPATQKIAGIFCTVLNIAYTLSLALGVLMALFAAFKYMTAAGDTSKVSEGHKALTWAIIGIAVAIFAGSAPAVVGSIVGASADSPC